MDGSVYIRHVKLEKGSIATDWTPAPEDKVNVSDMRKPANDVAGIEEVNAKQDKIGYTPADDSKVFHSTVTQLNSTDMNTVLTAGFYRLVSGGTNGMPNADEWTIYEVIPLNSTNGVQIAYQTNDTISGMRSWNTWSDRPHFNRWVQFADDSKVAHLSGANNFDTVPTVNNNPLLLASSLPSDLARTGQANTFNLTQTFSQGVKTLQTGSYDDANSLVNEGLYFNTNLSIKNGAGSITGGFIQVLSGGPWDRVRQFMYSDLDKSLVYTRVSSNNGSTWSNWVQIITSDQLPSGLARTGSNQEFMGKNTFDTAPIDKTTGNPYITKDGVPNIDPAVMLGRLLTANDDILALGPGTYYTWIDVPKNYPTGIESCSTIVVRDKGDNQLNGRTVTVTDWWGHQLLNIHYGSNSSVDSSNHWLGWQVPNADTMASQSGANKFTGTNTFSIAPTITDASKDKGDTQAATMADLKSVENSAWRQLNVATDYFGSYEGIYKINSDEKYLEICASGIMIGSNKNVTLFDLSPIVDTILNVDMELIVFNDLTISGVNFNGPLLTAQTGGNGDNSQTIKAHISSYQNNGFARVYYDNLQPGVI